MSGSFSIDIEVGLGKGGICIYCTNLTSKWTVVKKKKHIAELIKSFNNNKEARKYLPAEPDLSKKDVTALAKELQLYFATLSCSAVILSTKEYHAFLKMPEEVKELLKYCHERSAGRVLKQGKLKQHNVIASPLEIDMWVTLSDNNNIIIKEDKETTQIFGSFRIGLSTVIQKSDIAPNSFMLTSGEKCICFSTDSSREFNQWYQLLNAAVKKAGGTIDESDEAMKRQVTMQLQKKDKKKQTPDQIAKALQISNRDLKYNLQQLKKELDKASDQIDELNGDKEKLSRDQEQLRRQIRKSFEDTKSELTQTYELEHERLRAKIENVHRKLEIKTLKEQGFKGILRMFENYEAPVEDEGDDTADLIEFEEKQQGVLVDESQIRYVHKHLHKHEHRHIYHHRHHHIHDDTQNPTVIWTQTHTVAHTICHTHTEIKIKSKGLI